MCLEPSGENLTPWVLERVKAQYLVVIQLDSWPGIFCIAPLSHEGPWSRSSLAAEWDRCLQSSVRI